MESFRLEKSSTTIFSHGENPSTITLFLLQSVNRKLFRVYSEFIRMLIIIYSSQETGQSNTEHTNVLVHSSFVRYFFLVLTLSFLEIGKGSQTRRNSSNGFENPATTNNLCDGLTDRLTTRTTML